MTRRTLALGLQCVDFLRQHRVRNSVTLTTNYSAKQSQFTKPTSEPRASDPEESNESFDNAIRGWLL